MQLCLSKNDFQTNVHGLTTERMLKTFFAVVRTKTHTLCGDRLLAEPTYYLRFVSMCLSKVYGNRATKIPRVAPKQVASFQARGRWCLGYWSGAKQAQGGPDCRASGGWILPTAAAAKARNLDLKEYGGRVRLLPA